jgi:hypothetical protein
MYKNLRILTIIPVLCMTACIAEPEEEVDTTESSISNSGSSGSSYDYTYSCPGGGGGTAPIPEGRCENQYEAFTEAFGCNKVDELYSTCFNLYSCLGQSTSQYCSGY